MSLTAHPYVVLAEQQWKQQHLGGANRAPRRSPKDDGPPEAPGARLWRRIRHLPHVVTHLSRAA